MTSSVVKFDVIRTGDGVNSIPVGEMISKVAKIPVDDDLATAQDLSDLSLSIADVNDVAQEALTEAQQNATHVMSIKWEPSRDIIGAGDAALDGQLLSRATYPDAWAAIAAGIVPTVDDATWLADPTQRGKFTSGNGTTTFRLPDYNGKFAGSLGAVFLRGDGALSAGVAGAIRRGQVGQHDLAVRTTDYSGAVAPAHFASKSALAAGLGTGSSDSYNGWSDTVPPLTLRQNTQLAGQETRPLDITGCWVIKLFGAVVNVGSADAAQLASDYAQLASRVAVVESGKAVKKTRVMQREVLWAGSVDSAVTTALSRAIKDGELIQLAIGGGLDREDPAIPARRGRTHSIPFAIGGTAFILSADGTQISWTSFMSGYPVTGIYVWYIEE